MFSHLGRTIDTSCQKIIESVGFNYEYPKFTRCRLSVHTLLFGQEAVLPHLNGP